MKHPPFTALLAGVAAFALLLPATAAHAASEPDSAADAVAQTISEVAPSEIVAADLAPVSSGVAATLDGGGQTHVATDPSDGIEVVSADGTDVLSFTLPAAGRLDDAVVAEDGSVTYLGDAKTPSVNVVAAEDALRVTTVIDSPAQAQRFSYDFGAGATVEIQEDGGAIAYVVEQVTDPETGETVTAEKIVADVEAPWAKDANGVDVPTRYVASGSVLTQVVSHAKGMHAYPVTADPTFDRPNFFQYRVRFNRAETATIASGGAGVIASIGCGPMLPVCVLAGSVLWWNASNAQNSSPKRCVQITATYPYLTPGLIWWVDTYRGGPCR
ncbi:hypothetical protein [Microbacterium sp. SSM24]|uniref:hypothetical protein n=1 Tax=Microbacterium sp. SSM24 TaxID=2991714 RepID=UPI0022275C15|nr:hypothetical protein [Microbacterium sp. SSM24]MCW3493606.1 hypothetical protein [Microbacterium sp. SSM24]